MKCNATLKCFPFQNEYIVVDSHKVVVVGPSLPCGNLAARTDSWYLCPQHTWACIHCPCLICTYMYGAFLKLVLRVINTYMHTESYGVLEPTGTAAGVGMGCFDTQYTCGYENTRDMMKPFCGVRVPTGTAAGVGMGRFDTQYTRGVRKHPR